MTNIENEIKVLLLSTDYLDIKLAFQRALEADFDIQYYLNSLKSIISNQNQRLSADDIMDLKSWRSIDLSYRNLNKFPLELCYFPFLQKIDLAENYIFELKELPFQWIALEELNLQRNQFQYYPDDLSSFPALKKLNLSFNRIEQIVFNDKNCQIPHVNVNANQINKLESVSIQKNALSILELDNNGLQELPDLKHLLNLEFLYLRKNQIKQLTGMNQLKELRKIDLRENPLPIEAFYELESMKSLDTIIIEGQRNIPFDFFREKLSWVEIVS